MSAARTWMETPSPAREMVASAVVTRARRLVASVANHPPLRKVGGTPSPRIPSALSQTQLMMRKQGARSWPQTSRIRKRGGGCHPLLATIDRAQSSCALGAIAAVAMSVWERGTCAARTWVETPSHAREAVVSVVATRARRRGASAANHPPLREVDGTPSLMTPSALSQTRLMIRKRRTRFWL